VERFPILRGRVSRLGTTVLVFLGVVLFFVFLTTSDTLGIGPRASGLVGLAAVALGTLWFLVWMNLPGRVALGADGLVVDWRNEKRFVPFADVSKVLALGRNVAGKRFVGVAIALRDGDTVEVFLGEDGKRARRRVAELVERIGVALEAYKGEEDVDASVLDRGDRTIDAWRTRLRAIGEGSNAGPREAPVPHEKLWRIVEDPRSAERARVAAAVALSSKLDDGGRSRLRVAAEGTAEPRLRVALESVAQGDDDAAVEVLEKVTEKDEEGM
jgi:hypothetical protein